jgi:hypothetical protein
MLEPIKESGMATLEHDAEKWVPVFGKHREPDDDSKPSHRALTNVIPL